MNIPAAKHKEQRTGLRGDKDSLDADGFLSGRQVAGAILLSREETVLDVGWFIAFVDVMVTLGLLFI